MVIQYEFNKYPIKICKYPINLTFKGKYPMPQKPYPFLWGYDIMFCAKRCYGLYPLRNCFICSYTCFYAVFHGSHNWSLQVVKIMKIPTQKGEHSCKCRVVPQTKRGNWNPWNFIENITLVSSIDDAKKLTFDNSIFFILFGHHHKVLISYSWICRPTLFLDMPKSSLSGHSFQFLNMKCFKIFFLFFVSNLLNDELCNCSSWDIG